MKYCNQCGAEVFSRIPEGDNRLRFVCSVCRMVHYQNPKVVTGCLPEYEHKVLLCKRAIAPRYGYWTLPAGFMELDETSRQGAERETMEEANAQVEVNHLFAIYDLPYVAQVYLIYRAQLLNLDFSAGKESLEVDLFAEAEIPWDDIAFIPIKQTLKFFFQDRKNGRFRLHTGDIIKRNGCYDFCPGPGAK